VHIGPTAFLGVGLAAFPQRFNVSGAVVDYVTPGTPAQSAGLEVGDVIVSVNGQSVLSPTDLTTILQSLRPGDTIQLGWHNASGQSHSASVTLIAGPAG